MARLYVMQYSTISMQKLLAGLLLFLVLIGTPRFAYSQWVARGPYGVNLSTILFLPDSPETVIAAGFDGFFRSTDAGRSWNRQFLMYSDIFGYPVRAFPDRPNELLAAGDEVFRSSDRGLSWKSTNDTITRDGAVRDVEIDPADPSRVLAVTERVQVFRSTDRGKTWRLSNSGIDLRQAEISDDIPQLAFDPVSPATVYLMATRSRVFRSTDGGQNWKQIASNLDRNYKAYSLAINPGDNSILYLGRDDGLYRSTDAGVAWARTSLRRKTIQVSSHTQTPSMIYAAGDGLSVSTDGGNTWKLKNPPGCYDQFTGFGSTPDGKHMLMSGEGQGMLRSDDSGASWKYLPIHTYIDSITMDHLRSFADGRVIAFGYPEVYETKNLGKSWNLFIRSEIQLHYIDDIEIHPRDQDLVYASGDHLAKSTDGGKTWTTVRPLFSANSISLDPQDPKRIYALHGNKLLSSTDAGATWILLSSVPSQGARFLVVHPTNPRMLYVGARMDNRGGLFRSTDGGRSWQSRSAGIKGDAVMQLLIDPQNHSVLYLLEEKFSPPIQKPAGALSEQPMIYKSTNGGATWELKSQGLPSDAWVLTIELDPLNPERIYAGGSGVYVSEDGGQTWNAFDLTGWPSTGTDIRDLLFSQDNHVLLGATVQWGMLTYRLNR